MMKPCPSIARVVFMLAGFAVLAPAAGGEDDVPSGMQEAAAEHFQQGVRYYDEGKFEEAIEELRLANELSPNPLVFLKIGKCYSRLGNHARAMGFYRGYLRDESVARRDLVEHVIKLSRDAFEEEEGAEEALFEGLAELDRSVFDVDDDIEMVPADEFDDLDVLMGLDDDEALELAELAPLVLSDDPSGAGVETRGKEERPVREMELDPAAPREDRGFVDVTPEREADPLYEDDEQPSRRLARAWWFWAAIGTVAAGTAATVTLTSGEVIPERSMGPIDLR